MLSGELRRPARNLSRDQHALTLRGPAAADAPGSAQINR